MAEGLKIDNELLIHFIQELPVLWDKTLDIYKDRNATKNAWNKVCVQLRSDFDNLEDSKKNDFGKEVMKRWKHLRDAFIRSQKKYKQSKASGSQAAKKKRYIFNDDLQFLKKIYEERETEESYKNGDEDNNIEEQSAPTVPPAVITVEGTAEVVVSKVKQPTRQHKKMDEVDLKILQALQAKKKPEKKNDKLSFFESLLPHVDKFQDTQWLQCQMEFLQVISKIKNTYPFIPQTHNVYNPSTSQINQPFSVPHMPQQAFTTNIHSPQFTSNPGPAPQLTCSPITNYSQVIKAENIESRSSSLNSLSSTTTIDFTEL